MVEIKISDESLNKLADKFARGIRTATNKTMYAVSGKIKAAYDKYTPKKTGALRAKYMRSNGVASGAAEAYTRFIYRQPYARYQYWHHFKHYTTPGTNGEWDKLAEDEVKHLVFEEYKNQLKNVFK